MITKLYSFYDLPFEHDVCHLFEHVMMREFLFLLHKHGYNRAFFGWQHGQTVGSTIFFELSAYNQKIIQLFEDHLKLTRNFNEQVITRSIGHIEAEMRAKIVVSNKKILIEQLEGLAHLVKEQGKTSIPAKSPLIITESPRLFREVAVIVNVHDLSEETKKAFLCFYPAVLDIVRDAAIDNTTAYPTGTSGLVATEDSIGVAQRYTIKRNLDIDRIEDDTRTYLQDFNVGKFARNVQEYRKSFANDPQYNAAPIQFYGEIGIRASRQEIARLATIERMDEIINKATVRIEPVTGKLKELEWGP